MNQVLVYIFYSQFKKLNKNFRGAIGKGGQFDGEFPLFRRRHQTVSRAVSKLDGFMRLSNVAGFVFHILSIILVLYSFIFYPEFTSSLTYLFWLAINVNGLLFSASAGVVVNHMVRLSIRHTLHICQFDVTAVNVVLTALFTVLSSAKGILYNYVVSFS